jgi:hypothetical protein
LGPQELGEEWADINSEELKREVWVFVEQNRVVRSCSDYSSSSFSATRSPS